MYEKISVLFTGRSMKRVFVLLSVVLIGIMSVVNGQDTQLYHLPVFPENNSVKAAVPPSGSVVSPAEFSRAAGVYLSYRDYQKEIIRDIAREVALRGKVYMLVNSNDFSSLKYYLEEGNVNMLNIEFIHHDSNYGIWIRDYGAFYIYEDELAAIINNNSYAGSFPGDMADFFGINSYQSGQFSTGGNFMTDGNGMGFCSNVEFTPTPAVRERFRVYMGIDSLIILPKIYGDGTGHIDMASKFINDTTVFVGEYAEPDDGYLNNFQILNENAAMLDTLKNLQGRDFRVVRLPMPPVPAGAPEGNTDSYMNSLIYNRLVLVPIYMTDMDSVALNIYRREMPDYDVIGIDSRDISQYYGAIHCITNTHFSASPLLIQHRRVEHTAIGEDLELSFTMTPGFRDSETEGLLYYRNSGDSDFQVKEMADRKGVKRYTLEGINQDLEYYFSGTAVVGDSVFTARYPEHEGFITIQAGNAIVSSEHYEVATGDVDLHGNYPNPFNPATMISYHLKKDHNVNIQVFNIQGRMVWETGSMKLKAGSHRQMFDGSSFGSGVYFYSLCINGNVAVGKKMVLMK